MADSTFDSIILAGERFKLRGGVKVVTFEDNPQWSFDKASFGMPVPVFSPRRHPETKKHVKTVKELAGSVSQVLLHTDLTSDSALCFKALLQRSLSTHFMIDWDGTIYQGLDPMFVAYHAGDFNGSSIGVDINNRMKNLEREPSETPYNPDHELIATMSKKEYRRGGARPDAHQRVLDQGVGLHRSAVPGSLRAPQRLDQQARHQALRADG